MCLPGINLDIQGECDLWIDPYAESRLVIHPDGTTEAHSVFPLRYLGHRVLARLRNQLRIMGIC